MRRLALAVTVLAVALAASVARADGKPLPTTHPSATGPRSQAIYPPQDIDFAFTHKEHLATGILSCDDCHKADQSTSPADHLIPTHPRCVDCHAVSPPKPGSTAKPQNDCSLCHLGWHPAQVAPVRPAVFPTANLKFSHQQHLKRGIKCAACHGKLFKVAKATRQQLPTMATCFTCHDDVHASRRCDTCHLTGPDGRLQTSFPTGTLEPGDDVLHMDHGAGWRRNHSLAGRLQAKICDDCHTKKFCTDCHDGTLKPFDIHPADWISTHPVAARQDSLSCNGCHRRQSFCVTCHERLGIGVDAPTGVVRGGDPTQNPTFHAPDCAYAPSGQCQNLRFHPQGWINLAHQSSPNFHAWAARRNIMACASCHREETCLKCHATAQMSGLSFTPHPPGFTSVCKAAAMRNPRSCEKCHASIPTACQ